MQYILEKDGTLTIKGIEIDGEKISESGKNVIVATTNGYQPTGIKHPETKQPLKANLFVIAPNPDYVKPGK